MTENTRRSGRAIKYIYLATRPHGHRDRILLCLMASSQHGNSAEFRVRAKRILLTYSQVESNFDHQELVRLIGRLGARGCICRELHRNGGVHYHALLVFDSAYHTRDAHRFDVGGTHPNIQPIRWTPRRAYEYVQKDGDIIYNNLEDNDIDGPGTSSSTHWADIIASPDKATFLRKSARWILELSFALSQASRNTQTGHTERNNRNTNRQSSTLREMTGSERNSMNGTRRHYEGEQTPGR